MVGVPAASTGTTLLLLAAGLVVAAIGAVLLRRRLQAPATDARLVAAAVVLSLLAVPWVAWRFVEDVHTTTGLDPYERASAGPIQAFLPGYLVDGARARIPPRATWAVLVGPSHANANARAAFPALVLVTLFPRVSAPLDRADWLVAWGASPRAAGARGRVEVAHARQGPLPPVLVARRR